MPPRHCLTMCRREPTTEPKLLIVVSFSYLIHGQARNQKCVDLRRELRGSEATERGGGGGGGLGGGREIFAFGAGKTGSDAYFEPPNPSPPPPGYTGLHWYQFLHPYNIYYNVGSTPFRFLWATLYSVELIRLWLPCKEQTDPDRTVHAVTCGNEPRCVFSGGEACLIIKVGGKASME